MPTQRALNMRSLAENLQQVPAHSSLLQLATP
ncbi:hypothetical protein AK812_SmicGene47532, partial [Symbiodinium microadriaticum]